MATILVTKFREFTDVIMTLPVVYSACGSNPGTSFVFVTRPSLTQLFINPPRNLRVEGKDISAFKGLGGALKLWKELKNAYTPDFYVCLDNEVFFRSVTSVARIGGMRCSILREAPNKRQLIRKNNKIMLPLLTARSRYREAFFRAGIPVQEHFQGIFGKCGKGDPSLFSSVTPPPSGGETWVGIAPFAKHKGKSYPPRLMEEVLSILENEIPGLKVILFGGGEEERKLLGEWNKRHAVAISPAVARLGFPAELSLLSYLDVMLTMDSANMHLASLVGVPVITVWGATHPYCGFKGWHQNESGSISLPMPCRPCSLYGDRACHRGDYYCLTSIKPRFIADKVIAASRKEGK